jgi:hypothetical protein
MIGGVRLGIAHHLGWAVAVTADADHRVVDRRRIELLDDGLPAAPIHHEGGPYAMHRSGAPLSDDALATLVEQVRASARRVTAAALDALPAGIVSLSLRAWPDDFPTEVSVQRVVPHESSADSIMYRQVLAELAAERDWAVHRYDAARVEAEAAAVLGARAEEVLHGPRRTLGAPWNKDHRLALAATVVASG